MNATECRYEDDRQVDYGSRRRGRQSPAARVLVAPGNVVIPADVTALGAVASSTVAVTIFDQVTRRAGLCHFAFPRPLQDQKPTPAYGLPAVLAVIQGFLSFGSRVANLVAGIYGGASPCWANADQRQLAKDNVEIARAVLQRKSVQILDEDTGGERGRKLWFLTFTNEIALVKTDAIRQSDWFPLPAVRSWKGY